MRLGDFKALSSDCYGTLIDWEAGLTEALGKLRARAALPMQLALADFAACEARAQAASPSLPYPALLARVYETLAAQWGLTTAREECEKFGQSIGDWPAFGDSGKSLRYLKQHYRIFILSNVDRASFGLSNVKLGVTFDGVYTAEDIGSYKPALENFEYLLSRTAEHGVAKRELLHVAQSLFHDRAPANRIGIASAWIDRRGGQAGGATAAAADDISYDFSFESLDDLVRAHQEESGEAN